ncbi:hypothetical protein [Pseudonocardia phyllosphaerae]|uniref:hypothetical protein n=1 Tax=Pseudonocardia phyllosphaerae TaxID=3390502 RepID=UPI0039796E82
MDEPAHADEQHSAEDVAARREQRWIRAAAALLLGTAVLFVSFWVLVDDGAGRLEPGQAALFISLTTAPIVVALLLASVITRWRRRRGHAPSPLNELPTMRQRSRLLTRLRRGDPIPPEQHDLAIRVARDLSRRPRKAWLFFFLAASQVLQLLVSLSEAAHFFTALFCLSTVLLLVVGLAWSRTVTRVRERLPQLEAERP